MIGSAMQHVGQACVTGALNSLPEGLLILLFAWLLLRFMGGRNARTRFAVWFLTLLSVGVLCFLSGLRALSSSGAIAAHPAALTFPAFWAAILFAAWIALVCIALLRIAAGVWQVRTIRRRCTEVDFTQADPGLREMFRRFTDRPARLAVSDRVTVPAAFGFRKPTIVLPPWMLREYSAEQIRPILLHELEHVRRRDDWTNLLQKTMRAFFFFHPAVWWIDARLALEREMACDEAVIAATGNPRAYASCLIDLLEKSCSRRGWTMAQAAVRRAGETALRIGRIIAANDIASTRIWKPAVGLVSCACAMCCAILFCSPRLVDFSPGMLPHHAERAQILSPVRPAARTGLSSALVPSAAVVLPAAFHPRASAGSHSAAHPVLARRHSSRKPASFRRLAVARRRAAIAPRILLASADKIAVTAPPADQMLVVFTVTTAEYLPTSNLIPAGDLGCADVGKSRSVRLRTLELEETVTDGHRVQFWRLMFLGPQAGWQTFLPVQKSI